MNVLVTGATGFVGRRLVPALLDAGHEVCVLVRDRSSYDLDLDVDIYEGDLLEQGSFESALAGVDAAYYLVHSMGSSGDFEERDRQAARHFRAAASAAGVGRVIYLGGLGPSEEKEGVSAHLRSRQEVGRLLGDGTYDLTTLRAAVIVGEGSASFELIDQLTGRLPVMLAPKWVRTRCQPIAIDDVIAYLVGVLDAPETAGTTFEIGGPEVMTYQEMLQRTAEIAGRSVYIIPVPVLTPTLSSHWLTFVTDVPTSVAKPLIAGLKTPVVVENDRIREFVDIEPTSFETAVRRAFSSESSPSSPPVEATG
ncbi:NAD(P)H-binding protein [Natranaeroarchaeum sulfidigenes]|uniref:YbjT n=1 Tax=Natranaeroarchaeum sulfidigenes TaxID=2784880 RepID=A0A897MMC5_9EURY|nr:NAD(P)H-binding protein [Natranaeroarchaeum sulfidigenes]QSG01531.1 YbjT [Natranaeroarchaeum sulfidigenes]